MKDRPVSSQLSLIETLTRRERKILSLLAQDLTYREIATLETLALSSVKWYIQQIYTKLGVNKRQDALAHARALGLIEPENLQGSNGSLPSLPTGTVTFLFTDIVGSTPLWEKHPDAMIDALQIHNTALHKAFESQGGVVYKIVGDAFQAAFATASQALNAAIAGQQALNTAAWNELGPLLVRMGLHTGEALLDPGGDEYAVSHTKNRAARIMSAAHGGQILLSAETAELVNHQLPPRVSMKNLGEHHLKGMAIPENLYQVCAPDLIHDFPPLSSGSAQPHNLPTQLTSFIGREQEIAEIRELLEKHRLITINGSGGIGKTRLLLQTAAGLLTNYPNGVWFIDLASLTDPALVPQYVASVLGLQRIGEGSYRTIITNHIREKRLLLLLDNCEHLLDASAELAYHLLLHCPQVYILATSREPLDISGEAVFRVPSLRTPDPAQVSDPRELAQVESIQLFAERAAATLAGFTLSSDSLPVVANICRRLEGIPLAIELAAARVDMLSIAQIDQRLEDRFRLLTGGSRSALSRQRTLRASVDWSYNLLSEPERLVLQRLSVFSGGWTLEAAEAVCAGGDLKAWDILDVLTWLSKKSLIIVSSPTGAAVRYNMLETIRQYAKEKQKENDESAVLQDLHLAYYSNLVQELGAQLKTEHIQDSLKQLDFELDNIRAALSWALNKGDQPGALIALDMLVALEYYWAIRALYWETFPRFRRALSCLPENEGIYAERKAWGYYILSVLMGDHLMEPEAVESLNVAVRIFRQSGSRPRLAVSLALRSYMVFRYNENFPSNPFLLDENAIRDQEESFAIVQDLPPEQDNETQYLLAWTDCWNAAGELFRSPNSKKDPYAQQAQARFKRSGDVVGELYALAVFVSKHSSETKSIEKLPYADSTLRLAQSIDHKWHQWLMYFEKASIYYKLKKYPEFLANIWPAISLSLQMGKYQETNGHYTLLLDYHISIGEYNQAFDYIHKAISLRNLEEKQKHPFQTIELLTQFTRLEILFRRYATAARLLGFIEKVIEEHPHRGTRFHPKNIEFCKETLPSVMALDEFQAAYEEGQSMGLDKAVSIMVEAAGNYCSDYSQI